MSQVLPVVSGGEIASCSGNGACQGCGCAADLPQAIEASRPQANDGNSAPQNAAPHKSASAKNGSEALLDAPEHVLSTLEKDGTRHWIKPSLSQGKWWQRRRNLAYVLMVVFLVVPYIRIGDAPLIQLDIVAREFTFLGYTFLPTDTILVALLMLSAFVAIVAMTAVTGRVWCGWACPQTVYIEFLFRPIDRLFEGTVGRGGKPKHALSGWAQIARFAIYVVLCSVLAHTFLAYFVGTENLAKWLLGPPTDHPVAFAVMVVTTGLLTYDFFYFREQTCMIACPYGRFQSVMLDRQSLIVAYDTKRGEPRRRGKKKASDAGDCIDCNKCVAVCPTGIDIRNGLQMECINCTQCIDACDDIMTKVGRPTGLIRYSSQEGLEGKKWKLLRARTIVYPIAFTVLVGGFIFAASTKLNFDARILRGKGAPFSTLNPGEVTNTFNLRLVNRTKEARTYQVKVVSPEDVEIEIVDPELLQLASQDSRLVPLRLQFRSYLTQGDGNAPVVIEVVDDTNHKKQVAFRLLGPR